MNNLIKAFGTLLAITLAAITMAAQAGVTEQWKAGYDGPDHRDDVTRKVAVDAVGNVYVTGTSYSFGTGNDFTTVKYDSNGMELWVRRYTGPLDWSLSDFSEDQVADLAVDAGGNVYVTGSSYSRSSGNDYATVKYDTNGNELWVRRYNGPGNNYDNATALVIDTVGNVYVTGNSYSNVSGYDYATVKYDPNGNELWVRRYTETLPGIARKNGDFATALAVDILGNVYVTGYSASGSNYDYTTVKYDATGTELWVNHYDGPIHYEDKPIALAVDAAGSVYVTGYSYASAGGIDYATVKYNANGTELWVRRYAGPVNVSGYNIPTALAVDSAGNAYVTGSSLYGSFATVKYDTSGTELWVRNYKLGSYKANGAYALTVDALGNVYVAGSSVASFVGGDSGAAIIKYNTDGDEVWVYSYSGPDNLISGARSVTIDTVGNVYVAAALRVPGVPGNPSQVDYLTIKYSPDSQPAPTAVATASSTLLECVDLNGETVTLSGAGSSDPGGRPLTYSWTGPFGTASGVTVNVPVPLGTHVITLTVSNGSSSATATVTVTVQDTIAPYVNAGADVTLEAGSSAGAAYTVTPVSSDACSTTSVVITPVLSIYPLGATPVMVTATDASRNSASDSLVVTVVDTTPPTLTVPANISTSATGALTPVTLGSATATDAVDGVITVTNNAPASGFAVGTTTVIYTATDSHANSVSKSQLVTVTDTTGPTLTIPADIMTEATGALTPVVLGTASASDAVDGALVVNNNAPAAGFPVGMTLVLYTATDSHANSVSMSQRVTVTDTTAPTLNAPADITVTATGRFTPVNLGTASATDLVDGVVAVTNDAPLAGFPVGMATVTYTTTDSHGNSMTKTQRVTVTDSAAPLTIGNYTLVSSTRVSRTDFVYIYRAIIFNSGFTTRMPKATLSIATPGVTILDGTLSFGTVPAGTTATSTDTFSLRHDRSSAFSEADFHWQIQ